MQEQIGLLHFLQGCPEGLDQSMGQFLDKAYGIGQQYLLFFRQLQMACCRVKGRKEFILGKDLGTRKLV